MISPGVNKLHYITFPFFFEEGGVGGIERGNPWSVVLFCDFSVQFTEKHYPTALGPK